MIPLDLHIQSLMAETADERLRLMNQDLPDLKVTRLKFAASVIFQHMLETCAPRLAAPSNLFAQALKTKKSLLHCDLSFKDHESHHLRIKNDKINMYRRAVDIAEEMMNREAISPTNRAISEISEPWSIINHSDRRIVNEMYAKTIISKNVITIDYSSDQKDEDFQCCICTSDM